MENEITGLMLRSIQKLVVNEAGVEDTLNYFTNVCAYLFPDKVVYHDGSEKSIQGDIIEFIVQDIKDTKGGLAI